MYSLPLSNTMHATETTPAPKAHPNKDTLIVFDWDDTLLCSYWLSSRGLRLDSDPAKVSALSAELTELSHSIIAVLNLALSYGPVTVITNAETGWVQLSCQKFIPLVLPMLPKLTIISARSTYESMFGGAPLKWKYYAFQERIQSMASSVPGSAASSKEKNVLSFGDSHVEREAVRACTRGMLNTKTKSVKFSERPSVEQLRRQIELVTNCFGYIHNHDGDLDLQLTVTVNTNGGQQPGAANAAVANKETGAATAGAKQSSDGTESKAMYGGALNAATSKQAATTNNSSPLLTTEEKPASQAV